MPAPTPTAALADVLARGRACYDRRQWNDAFEALALADQSGALDAGDLQRLAWSAGLTARDEAMLAIQERVYHALLKAGEDLPAARAAFWLGFRLLARGDAGRAGGWLGPCAKAGRPARRRLRGTGLSLPAERPETPESRRVPRGARVRRPRGECRRTVR